MNNAAKKVIIGMSGGVDSSVSALLLKKAGYTVEGLFMKNWEEDDDSEYCSAEIDVNDAEAVCKKIGIPLHTVNFAQEYWQTVFEHFLSEYQAGRTPNPDVLCNKEIKFKAFLDYARTTLGADYIATGHYARKTQENGRYQLQKSHDKNKDQTYFLYLLSQEQLAPALFPLADITKSEVRQIAEEHDLVTYNKKDSTGICFIGERKFKTFLSEYLPHKPGNIEDLNGRVLGRHDGLMYYTYGQRNGLQIGGTRDSSGEAWYVLKKDLSRNVLIVGQGKDHPLLYKSRLICNQVNWISGEAPEFPYYCQAKTRYFHDVRNINCLINPVIENGITTDKLELVFEVAQRSITPGQAVVFYQGDLCLGGGTITDAN